MTWLLLLSCSRTPTVFIYEPRDGQEVMTEQVVTIDALVYHPKRGEYLSEEAPEVRVLHNGEPLLWERKDGHIISEFVASEGENRVFVESFRSRERRDRTSRVEVASVFIYGLGAEEPSPVHIVHCPGLPQQAGTDATHLSYDDGVLTAQVAFLGDVPDTHAFDVCWDGTFTEGAVTLSLGHDPGEDTGETAQTKTLLIDLATVESAWADQGGGVLSLAVGSATLDVALPESETEDTGTDDTATP